MKNEAEKSQNSKVLFFLFVYHGFFFRDTHLE